MIIWRKVTIISPISKGIGAKCVISVDKAKLKTLFCRLFTKILCYFAAIRIILNTYTMMSSIAYNILCTIGDACSKLPFGVHYFCSDYILYPLVYKLVGYRKKVVRRNLANSFPEKSEEERRQIERDFYHLFCDYIVETIKLADMKPEQMMKHMAFKGMDKVEEYAKEGRSVVVYIAHSPNWEWITSLPLFLKDQSIVFGQIYHPLRNDAFDRIFLELREQYGSISIPMKRTLRQILEMKKQGKHFCIGFVADQIPKWEAIHHWVNFMHQETPVFTGTEKIARMTDSAVFFMSLKRVKRSEYEAEFHLITEDCKMVPDNGITERYFQLVEDHLRQYPAQWLWTHNRWKRTKEEWEKRKKK